MMIPASFFTFPPTKKKKKKHKQTTKQRSLPACLPLEETKKERKQASKQASKKERRRGGREKKGELLGLVCLFVLALFLVPLSNTKQNTQHNPKTLHHSILQSFFLISKKI
jgi:Flp pilus assembly protein TadB